MEADIRITVVPAWNADVRAVVVENFLLADYKAIIVSEFEQYDYKATLVSSSLGFGYTSHPEPKGFKKVAIWVLWWVCVLSGFGALFPFGYFITGLVTGNAEMAGAAFITTVVWGGVCAGSYFSLKSLSDKK